MDQEALNVRIAAALIHSFDMENTPDRALRGWATRQAHRLLFENGQINVSGIPSELWGTIAEFLAFDDGIFSLPDLNLANREIHEGTLPVLYETVKLKEEDAFTRSIGNGTLDGFRFTRYLFVNDVTLPLLRMHQRYQALLSGSTTPPPSDFTDIFPRLVMFAQAKPDSTRRALPPYHYLNRYPPQHITLYKPLSLSAMKQVCTPVKPGEIRAASFFGSYVPNVKPTKRNTLDAVLCDIVGLTLKPGAYLNPSDPQDMSKCLPSTQGTKFTLKIEDEADAPGVQETLKVVLDHLKAFAGAKQVIIREKWIKLVLHCAPSVLLKWIDLFQEAQPLFLALDVELSGISTRQDVQRYIAALAEVYSENWTHRSNTSSEMFVELHAFAPSIHQRDIDERTGEAAVAEPLTEDHRGGYCAQLITGHDDPNPAPGRAGGDLNHFNLWHGFTARIDETLRYKGEEDGHPQLISDVAFPMTHIPIPPVDPVREQPTIGRLPPDMLRDHFRYQQRRITPVLSARLRAAGHDVPPDPVPVPPGVARARGVGPAALPQAPAVAAGFGGLQL